MKKLFSVCMLLTFILILGGCSLESGAKQEAKTLKIGVTSGPHAEILEQVKKVAEQDGLNIEIVEFNDYVQPNMALDQGELDANAFQHQPFLDSAIQNRGYKLVSIAKTVILPMGIYSEKIKNLADLKEGASVAIPNDPSNAGRALLLLKQAGLIELRPEAGADATVMDITANPKNLQIKELEAALIPRAMADVDVAAINTSYALKAGLVPARDGLVLENSSSPYTNVLVVREQDKNNPAFQKLIKAYHSEEIKRYLTEHFKGSVLPGW